MPAINTHELTGAALDWAVAKAEGLHIHSGWQREWDHAGITDWRIESNAKEIVQCQFDGAASRAGVWRILQRYQPSTDWYQADPIIARHGISTVQDFDTKQWFAGHYGRWGLMSYASDTPLVAAMRCHVASVLGESVDVPQELAP